MAPFCDIHANSSRALQKTINLDYEVSSVSIHPGYDKFVAGGSSDPWVRIHEYESGKQLGIMF